MQSNTQSEVYTTHVYFTRTFFKDQYLKNNISDILFITRCCFTINQMSTVYFINKIKNGDKIEFGSGDKHVLYAFLSKDNIRAHD